MESISPRHYSVHKRNHIKWHLGKSWQQLHPAVQRRFNRLPTEQDPIIYVGNMEQVTCSKAGRLFAFLTKIIGNPLSPYQGKDVKMEVTLTTRENMAGVFWCRTYYFPGKKPFSVTSVKKDEAGRMMEMVGGGFGMFLDVYAENGELHFKSTRYFWKLIKCYVPLPHWLSPGKTHVIHQDLGQGSFRFTITMDHWLLKRTFYQTGIFHERDA